MYEYLRGKITRLSPTEVVIDVGGVGYLLSIPLSTSEVLHEGRDTVILSWLQVREDALRLFGFATSQERTLFLLLQKVSGIGPALALNILSRTSVDDLVQMLVEGRVDKLKKLKGVGPKTAERLVTELREDPFLVEVARREGHSSAESEPDRDAVQALIVLGYQERHAAEAVAAAREASPEASIQDLIRAALRTL